MPEKLSRSPKPQLIKSSFFCQPSNHLD